MLKQQSPRQAAGALLETARFLSRMQRALAGLPCALPCTLDTVGVAAAGPVYIG